MPFIETVPLSSSASPFRSFWMAGYECTDQLNAFGDRVDLLTTTGHLDRLEEDYRDLATFGIRTVREGIRWSVVEKLPGQYNWSAVATMIRAARRHNIQQVWDLCHFGFPADLTPLHPHFTGRFVALCQAFVAFYRTVDPAGELIITPINEVGFLSWLGGEVRGTAPYCRGYGWEVKYALVKAYIQGALALKQADARVRILTTEPLVNMVPPLEATDAEKEAAAREHAHQFQVLDMLCGRICPELGGRPGLIDITGFNFYYNNQWVCGSCNFLPWLNEVPDERWRPLSSLLSEVYDRYGLPLVLSETSHPGEDRPEWIRFVAAQCAIVLQQQIPLWGICWYPIIDRPDWDFPDRPWHRSGLWDIPDPVSLQRILCPETAAALLEAQAMLDTCLETTGNPCIT